MNETEIKQAVEAAMANLKLPGVPKEIVVEIRGETRVVCNTPGIKIVEKK